MYRFLSRAAPSAVPAEGQSANGRDVGTVSERDGYHVFGGRTIVVDLQNTNGRDQRFDGSDWLQEHFRCRRPLGFDMEWRPDREKDSDNPVALLQFADSEMALLLRTHTTARWLPQLVMDVLMSPAIKKICVGYDGSDRKKIESSFGFLLYGVVDLAELGPRKGLQHTGLKHMAGDLGWRMRKESRTARSDWMAQHLTPEQIQYAAEDAYFTYMIFMKLDERPDALGGEPDEECGEQQSALSLKPGWAEQGVVRRNDGLRCELCGTGPMLRSDVMAKHLESKNHLRKMRAMEPVVAPAPAPAPAPGLPDEVPEDMAARGITLGGPHHPRVRANEYYCALCDSGPLQTLQCAGEHLRGRHHLKNEQRPPEPEELPEELEAAGIEVCDDPVGSFRCLPCDAGPFTDLQSVRQHVVGKLHLKRCCAAAPSEAQAEPGPFVAAAAPAPRALEEEVEILPGYVGIWDSALWCCLCCAKANNLQNMLQHLQSDKHSKACYNSGRPALLWVKETGRFVDFETGRRIDRDDDEFDTDLLPRPEAPRAASGQPPQPAPGAPPLPPGPPPLPPPGPPAQSALQRAPRARSESCRRVRFRLEEDEVEAEPAARGLQPRQAQRSPIAVSAPAAPLVPKDPETARAWSCWSGSAKKASCDPCKALGWKAQGCHFAARVDVPAPPPGWVWDASTCLSLARGEVVEAVHTDGQWVYGKCGAREGWCPAWALEPFVSEAAGTGDDGAHQRSRGDEEPQEPRLLPAEQQPAVASDPPAAAAASSLKSAEDDPEVRDAVRVGPWTDAGTGGSAPPADVRGQTLWARADVGVPAGWTWDPSCCLQLAAGDAVEVLASEGEWLYARSGHREGWLQLSAVHSMQETGDADQRDSNEVPASSGEATFGGEAGTSRRDKVYDGGCVTLHEDLVMVIEGTGEAVRIVDGDSEASTAPPSPDSAREDDSGVEAVAHGAAAAVAEAVAGGFSKPCTLSVVQRVAGPPEGMDGANFLLLEPGEVVLVRYLEDEWLWGRQQGDLEGWAPTWAFDLQGLGA